MPIARRAQTRPLPHAHAPRAPQRHANDNASLALIAGRARNLRHTLRAMAADPAAAAAPLAALKRLRPAVEAAQAALSRGTEPARAAAHARLLDAAVAGLLHLARAVAGRDASTALLPLAAAAPRSADPAHVLVILPADAEDRARGRRYAAFLRRGLRILGLACTCEARSVRGWARLASHTAEIRFLRGRYDLFAAFAERRHAPH